MSEENVIAPAEEQPIEERRTDFTLRYADTSRVVGEEGKSLIALFAHSGRDDVKAKGKIKDVVPLREALSALHEVVKSDFRYKPKDRTAYMAYQRMRKASAGLSVWEAQRQYFEWLARNDPMAWMILDPVVTVHPDLLLFEVFSKDEGSYAQLSVDWKAFELEGKVSPGTTNVDFSKTLYDGVQRMRSYRETTLSVGRDSLSVQGDKQPEVIEKKIKIPDSWLRGFLQVQTAATLPDTSFNLAPIDLYNLLRQLRMHADEKRKGRAIRVELVPGERPRLVLEPWELVLETGGRPYAGQKPQVVKVWGRRRLKLLARFLPFTEQVEVHLLGPGLPSFWVLRGPNISMTLGLTGFSSANWAQSLGFDVLLPRSGEVDTKTEKVLEALQKKNAAIDLDLTGPTKLKQPEVLAALQAGCQQGLVMYDVAGAIYRYRPLTEEPLDPKRLEFRNDREKQARDLLAQDDAIKIAKENRIFGVGLELTGKAAVAADKREYRPQLLLDDEGRVRKAECTCTFFRKHGLKEGPCPHLIALKLLQAELEKKRAEGRGKARGTVVVETRTYVRRHAKGEKVCQVSLDRQRFKVRWGERSDERLRVQNLWFDSVADARTAYFARIDELETQGYLDATAG
jgi:hypothetical protein